MPLQSKINSSECTEPTLTAKDKPTYARASKSDGSQRNQLNPKGKKSNVEPPPPSIFQIGQRVSFFNKKGVEHFGTVGWTGRKTKTRNFDYVIIGIKTVSNLSACYNSNGQT